MSGFNFGQSNSGFTFGTPNAAAPATGFGLQPAAQAAAGDGFTFGATAPTGTNPAGTGGFSFGTPAKSTAATGGFSFGTPATASFGLGAAAQTTAASGLTLGSTATPAAGSGFSLGGGAPAGGGGFTFGAAALTQSQPAAAPAAAASTASFGGFSLATKPLATTAAATVASTTPAAPGGGFTFGTGAPTLTLGAQPATTAAAAAAAPASAGFSLGIKPSSTPAPPATTLATAPSLFSAPASTAAPATTAGFTLGVAPTPAASTAPAATSATGGALPFMLKPLGAATSTPASAATTAPAAAATAAGVTGFTLGIKPASSAAATTTTTTAPATTAPPVMTYAQLEGLINKWSLELEDQERHFLQQATQVNAWDRMLVENGEKITSLHKEMEKVKLDQKRLDQELDFILSQQKELEDLLCPLEESVKEQSGTIYMQNADEERERTYKLAENVDAQLKRMSQDLKEIIEHLNTSSGPADTSDPLQQICKILNAHMDSLQWVDQNSVLLQRRVEEVSKMCDNQRKEQEKTFRLNFD
ncbi:nucleoporin 62 like [Synchiropus picturatus]